MDLQLDDKTALVTGSTAGIGHAIATTLAREGARVVVNGRTDERVRAAQEAIRDAVPDADVDGVAADLSGAKGVNALTDAVPTLDILVNNVGIFEPKDFAEITDDDWFRLFETNVMSGVRLSRHFLPQMKEQGWGRIVFISSESAVQIPEEMIHYGMTKSAQVSIARGMAETTEGTGVTVNSVLAGPMASEGVTEFVKELAREQDLSPEAVEEQFFNTARPTSLLQRFIEPDEIAPLVAYLCSPQAVATNGAALRADGGVVRAML